jgi:hypothetical protein
MRTDAMRTADLRTAAMRKGGLAIPLAGIA